VILIPFGSGEYLCGISEKSGGGKTAMKINCISCGHTLELDDAYDDFGGLVKCYVCGGLLEIKTAEGKIQSVNLAELPQRIIRHPARVLNGLEVS
jgi:hypothetical protein